jgi:hypothetical protein
MLVTLCKKVYDEGVMNIPYILTDNSLTAILNGVPYTIQSSHENWGNVIEAVKQGVSEKELLDLIDTASVVSDWSEGSVEVIDGHVYFNGEVVHGTIVDKILSFIKDGISPTPLVKFLTRLMQNPSRRSVTELYSFLEHGNMPITPDGYFLGYKSVRSDWTDHYSGKFSNRVGEVLSMPRNSVCDDANMGCSYGFHVGSLEYATNFGGSDRKVVIVKVDPADVVSVPHDCDFQKMRTSRYEVVGTFDAPLPNGYYDGYDTDSDEDEEYDDDDYGTKPSGDLYYKVRDNKGRFVAKKK